MVFSAYIVPHTPFHIGLIIRFDDGKNRSCCATSIASLTFQNIAMNIIHSPSDSAYQMKIFKKKKNFYDKTIKNRYEHLLTFCVRQTGSDANYGENGE